VKTEGDPPRRRGVKKDKGAVARAEPVVETKSSIFIFALLCSALVFFLWRPSSFLCPTARLLLRASLFLAFSVFLEKTKRRAWSLFFLVDRSLFTVELHNLESKIASCFKSCSRPLKYKGMKRVLVHLFTSKPLVYISFLILAE
jgi:hypothetical protein